jgi:hypothetical protein
VKKLGPPTANLNSNWDLPYSLPEQRCYPRLFLDLRLDPAGQLVTDARIPVY